jgi:GST-like protein
MIKLYGVPGWGSAISEVMLTLADIPYQFINVDGFDQPGPQRELLQKLNPLCQVPTLELENGAIMTETAAIALMVLDRCPDLARPWGRPNASSFSVCLSGLWLTSIPRLPMQIIPNAGRRMRRNSCRKTALNTGNPSICGSKASSRPPRLRWGNG